MQDSNARTLKQEALQDRQEVADKLIAVFLGKPAAEWRKLIAFSKRWPALADRCSALPFTLFIFLAAVIVLETAGKHHFEQVLVLAQEGTCRAWQQCSWVAWAVCRLQLDLHCQRLAAADKQLCMHAA